MTQENEELEKGVVPLEEPVPEPEPPVDPEPPVEPDPVPVTKTFLDRKGTEHVVPVDEYDLPVFSEGVPVPLLLDGVAYYPMDFGEAVYLWSKETDEAYKIYIIDGELTLPKDDSVNYPLLDAYGSEYQKPKVYKDFTDRHGATTNVETDFSGKPIFTEDTPVPLIDAGIVIYPDSFGTDVYLWSTDDTQYRVNVNDGVLVVPADNAIKYPLVDALGQEYARPDIYETFLDRKSKEHQVLTSAARTPIFNVDTPVPLIVDGVVVYPPSFGSFVYLWSADDTQYKVPVVDGEPKLPKDDGRTKYPLFDALGKQYDAPIIMKTFKDRKGSTYSIQLDQQDYPIFKEDTPVPLIAEDGVVFYPKDFGNAVYMWDVNDQPVKVMLGGDGSPILPTEGVEYPITDLAGVEYQDPTIDPNIKTEQFLCRNQICEIEREYDVREPETSRDIILAQARCRIAIIENHNKK